MARTTSTCTTTMPTSRAMKSSLGGVSDDHFAQSGVSNGEAGYDRTIVEGFKKHFTVSCHVCGGFHVCGGITP